LWSSDQDLEKIRHVYKLGSILYQYLYNSKFFILTLEWFVCVQSFVCMQLNSLCECYLNDRFNVHYMRDDHDMEDGFMLLLIMFLYFLFN